MGQETSKPKSGLSAKEINLLKRNTNHSEQELRDMYEEFKQECPSGKMDKKEFHKFYKKLMGTEDKEGSLSGNMFAAFDQNGDGSITFDEFILTCAFQDNKDLESKLEFAFELMDTSNDGYISHKEMTKMMKIGIKLDNSKDTANADPKVIVDQIFEEFGVDKDHKLSREQFIQGCRHNKNLKEIFGSG